MRADPIRDGVVKERRLLFLKPGPQGAQTSVIAVQVISSIGRVDRGWAGYQNSPAIC